MPSRDKKEKVKQIKKWFNKSESLLVLHYKGLSVSEANELRVALSGMDCELRVVKNTLTRIALADSPKEGVTPLIDGPVAVAFVNEDPAAVAKVIRDFGKGRQEFYLRGGLLEGRVLDGKQVEAFAALPTREVLLSQLVGVVQAPLSRMIGTVVAPARKMLGLFQALAATKEVTEEAEVTEKAAQSDSGLAAERPSEEQSGEATAEAVSEKEATIQEVAVTEQPAAAVTEPAAEPQVEEQSVTEAPAEPVSEEPSSEASGQLAATEPQVEEPSEETTTTSADTEADSEEAKSEEEASQPEDV